MLNNEIRKYLGLPTDVHSTQSQQQMNISVGTSEISQPSTLMSSPDEIPDSNPNALTQSELQQVSEAIQSLSPDGWIVDDCVNWYSRHLMEIYGVDLNAFVTPGSVQSFLVHENQSLHQFFINKIIQANSRYLFLPINDALINESSGLHWGLIVIDTHDELFIFLDPLYDVEDHRQDVGKNLHEINSFLNQVISKVDETLHQLNYRLIIVPVIEKQTPNDCGIYVLEYMRGLLELLTSHELSDQPLIQAAGILLQNSINAQESRQVIKLYLQSLQPTIVPPTLPQQQHSRSDTGKKKSPKTNQPAGKEINLAILNLLHVCHLVVKL
ncbi:hypothetical protein GEMRC1_004008 [Eukaryota sp. GEM-RC1]